MWNFSMAPRSVWLARLALQYHVLTHPSGVGLRRIMSRPSSVPLWTYLARKAQQGNPSLQGEKKNKSYFTLSSVVPVWSPLLLTLKGMPGWSGWSMDNERLIRASKSSELYPGSHKHKACSYYTLLPAGRHWTFQLWDFSVTFFKTGS